MKFDINNIDRSNWKKFRFDEIAYSISERVEPGETDLDIYVGLEHLDPETIHIKRTGVPSDVEGTKLRVYKGDVIFGKRRAYQRKAAIAHFDGICSAHALVLRANEKVIDPKLFPFFMHSDFFMHRAIDISVGSLSPTINWGTLKTEEFLLPPKEQQVQLAELLWAADEVVENNMKLGASLYLTQKSLLKEYFMKGANLVPTKIKDLGIVFTGNTPPTSNKSFWNGQIPFITPAEINDQIEPIYTNRCVTEEGVLKGREVVSGDILVVCIGSTIGKVSIAKERCITNQQINIVRPKRSMTSKFLFYNLLWHKNMIISKAGATAVPILNKTSFENIEIPVSRNDDDNSNLGNVLSEIQERISNVEFLGVRMKQIKKQLVNQIFSA